MKKVNKVALKFSDENIEKKFKKEYYYKSITLSRISFVIVILLYAAFGYIDFISSENYYKIFFTIRYIIVIPLLVGVLLFSFNKYFIKVWQELLSLCFVAGGTGIIYMLLKNPENIYYYGGLFLIFSAGYFFVKLRFFAATISGISLLIIYNIGIIIFQVLDNVQFDYIIVTNAFYISANIISSVALYNLELLERKNFYQQNLLIDKQNEISLTNQTLEVKINDRTKQLSEHNLKLISEIGKREIIEKELIAAREKAEATEIRFRAIVEQAVEGITIADLKGNYLLVNSAFCGMTGYSSKELLKMKVFDMLESQKVEEINSDFFGIRREDTIKRKNDSTFPILIVINPINIGSETLLLSMVTDITERKNNEEQTKINLAEKTVLIQEVYHRTKNNMAVITAMLSMESRRSENDYVKSTFREINNKIQAMSLVHQKLYKAKDLSNINLKEYIEDLVKLIMQSYGVLSETVKLKFELQDVKILIDSAVPLGLIINELVSNIFKHAFPENQESEIVIRLSKEEDKMINFELIDNGIGFPKNFDPRKDGLMGLVSVFSIAENQLKGEISVKSENGVRWCIKIKDDKHKERI